MLVDQDSVIMKGFVAVSVEFPGKQSFPRSEGICRIHNDEIVFVMGGTNEFQTVLIENMQTGIIKGTGGLRKIFSGDLHHLFIDLYHVNVLDLRITGQFPDHTAVSGSDDQYRFYIGMHRHWNMVYAKEKGCSMTGPEDAAIERLNVLKGV